MILYEENYTKLCPVVSLLHSELSVRCTAVSVGTTNIPQVTHALYCIVYYNVAYLCQLIVFECQYIIVKDVGLLCCCARIRGTCIDKIY